MPPKVGQKPESAQESDGGGGLLWVPSPEPVLQLKPARWKVAWFGACVLLMHAQSRTSSKRVGIAAIAAGLVGPPIPRERSSSVWKRVRRLGRLVTPPVPSVEKRPT